mgnify:CR=1 FL=1
MHGLRDSVCFVPVRAALNAFYGCICAGLAPIRTRVERCVFDQLNQFKFDQRGNLERNRHAQLQVQRAPTLSRRRRRRQLEAARATNSTIASYELLTSDPRKNGCETRDRVSPSASRDEIEPRCWQRHLLAWQCPRRRWCEGSPRSNHSTLRSKTPTVPQRASRHFAIFVAAR